MTLSPDDSQEFDTLEAEVSKYINMAPTDLGLLGQALLIYGKCHDPSTDMSGCNGEWWMSLDEVVRRNMVAGLALPQMVSVRGLCEKYLTARDVK